MRKGPIIRQIKRISEFGGNTSFPPDVEHKWVARSLGEFIEIIGNESGGTHVEAVIDINKRDINTKNIDRPTIPEGIGLFTHSILFHAYTNFNNVVVFSQNIGDTYCGSDAASNPIIDESALKTYYTAGLELLKIIKACPNIKSHILATGLELTKENYFQIIEIAKKYEVEPWSTSENPPVSLSGK